MTTGREWRGLLALAFLTTRRQIATKKTLVALFLVALACFSSVRWRAMKDPNSARQQARTARSPEWMRNNWPDRLLALGMTAALKVPDPAEYVRVNYRPNP